MVMLQAFVDDSSSDAGDKRLFLAGYINGAEQWAAFSKSWEKELRRYPAINYFKMAEAQNLKGEFRRWSAGDRDAKVMALANVIHLSRPWSVHCSVSRVDYARLVAPVAPYSLQNPYFACFWGIIHAAASYHRDLGIEGTPPVDFVFDEQQGVGDEAALWYQWAKSEQEPELRSMLGATPIFRDDKQVLPLQAADMLAWHLRREHEQGGLEERAAMSLLIGQGAYHEIDARTLAKLAKKMSRVPGVHSIRDKATWKEHKKVLSAHVVAGLPPPHMSFPRLLYLDWKLRLKNWWSRVRYPR